LKFSFIQHTYPLFIDMDVFYEDKKLDLWWFTLFMRTFKMLSFPDTNSATSDKTHFYCHNYHVVEKRIGKNTY
jgi:hypothetical protein